MPLALISTPVLVGLIAALVLGGLVAIFLLRSKGSTHGGTAAAPRPASNAQPATAKLPPSKAAPARPGFNGSAAEKLAALEQIGISLNEGITLEMVSADSSYGQLDSDSMLTFLHSISGELYVDSEDDEFEEPVSSTCRSLYSFDTECIDGNEGEYADKVRELAALAQGDLLLEDVKEKFEYEGFRDYGNSFDYDKMLVTITFVYKGQPQELKFEQKDDWFDPRVMAMLDELLKSSGSARRFFGLPGDGQDALIGCLLPEQISKLAELAGVEILAPADAVAAAIGEGQFAEEEMIRMINKGEN
ncbi:hypothetical protein IT575_15505 [bacterium]|nr:hypothetical protein [bacterium]